MQSSGSISLPRLRSYSNLQGSNTAGNGFAGGLQSVTTVTISPFQQERAKAAAVVAGSREAKLQHSQTASSSVINGTGPSGVNNQSSSQRGNGSGTPPRLATSQSKRSLAALNIPALDTSRLQAIVALTEAQRDAAALVAKQRMNESMASSAAADGLVTASAGSRGSQGHSKSAAMAAASSAAMLFDTDRAVTEYIKGALMQGGVGSQQPIKTLASVDSMAKHDPLKLQSAAQTGLWPPKSENHSFMLSSAVILKNPALAAAAGSVDDSVQAVLSDDTASAAGPAASSNTTVKAQQPAGFMLDAWGKPRIFETKVNVNAHLTVAAIVQRIRQKLSQRQSSGTSMNRTAMELHRAFRFFDLDNTGTVTRKDLEKALQPFNLMLPAASVDDLLAAFSAEPRQHSSAIKATPSSKEGNASANSVAFSYPVFIQAVWLEALAEAQNADTGGLPGDRSVSDPVPTARLVQPLLKQSSQPVMVQAALTAGLSVSLVEQPAAAEVDIGRQAELQKQDRVRALVQAQTALAQGNSEPSMTEREQQETKAILQAALRARMEGEGSAGQHGSSAAGTAAGGSALWATQATSRSSSRTSGDLTRRRVPGTATFMPRYLPRTARSQQETQLPGAPAAADEVQAAVPATSAVLESKAPSTGIISNGAAAAAAVLNASQSQPQLVPHRESRNSGSAGASDGSSASPSSAEITSSSSDTSSSASDHPAVFRLSSIGMSKADHASGLSAAAADQSGPSGSHLMPAEAGAGNVDALYHYRTRHPNDAQWSFNNYGREWYTGDAEHRVWLLNQAKDRLQEHNTLHWSYNNRVGLDSPLRSQPIVRGVAQACYKSIEHPRTGQLVRDPFHEFPSEFSNLKCHGPEPALPKSMNEVLPATDYGAQLSAIQEAELAPPVAAPTEITVADALLACGCSVTAVARAKGSDGALACPCPKAHALAHARFGKAGCLHIQFDSSADSVTFDGSADPCHTTSKAGLPCGAAAGAAADQSSYSSSHSVHRKLAKTGYRSSAALTSRAVSYMSNQTSAPTSQDALSSSRNRDRLIKLTMNLEQQLRASMQSSTQRTGTVGALTSAGAIHASAPTLSLSALNCKLPAITLSKPIIALHQRAAGV